MMSTVATNEQFELFMSQLRDTNLTLDSFCDFNKIGQNVDNIKLSLCILNSLIGVSDLRKAVELIWARDRTAFSVMEILIAVRPETNKKFLNASGTCVPIHDMFKSVNEVMTFLNNTGLADIFQSKKINDLVDYVFGIETGMDTNSRKNRGGVLMERTISSTFENHNIGFRKEVYSSEWDKLTNALGDDTKRFDFVITTKNKNYLIEVNFYSDGGSKLNEVARSYSNIAPKINSVPGFEFVWITDGIGWRKAKNKLQEAYKIIPNIYNLTDITNFINKIKADNETTDLNL